MNRRYIVRGSSVVDTAKGRRAAFSSEDEARAGASAMNYYRRLAEAYMWSSLWAVKP